MLPAVLQRFAFQPRRRQLAGVHVIAQGVVPQHNFLVRFHPRLFGDACAAIALCKAGFDRQLTGLGDADARRESCAQSHSRGSRHRAQSSNRRRCQTWNRHSREPVTLT